MDGVAIVWEGLEGGDFATVSNFNVVLACGIGEALHDGFGGVSGGEHPPVGFGLEGDAMVVEPGNSVGGVKAVEGAVQATVATGVVLDEFAGVRAVVGDVATAAARDADFGENFF